MSLSAPTITANGVATTLATATVADQNGNPISSQTVTFTSSGTQTVTPVTTSTPGTYEATITSSTLAGPFTITATDTSAAPNIADSTPLTQTAGPVIAAGLFWADYEFNTIGRVNFDGSVFNEDFLTGRDDVYGVAVQGPHLYYADFAGNAPAATSSLVGVSNLDATIAPPFANPVPGGGAPADVAANGSYVYWANFGQDAIGRTSANGSGSAPTWITLDGAPFSVVVDGSYIYWANFTAKTIGRANLDGTGVNQDFITTADSPSGVAVDGSHVYWTNDGFNEIGRANLDGTSVNQDFISLSQTPWDVAVDSTNVYWTDPANNSIGRANIDGTGATDGFVTDLGEPHGLTVEPGTATLSLSNSTIAADGSSTSTATFTATDAYGNPVSGDAVTMTSSGSQDIGPVTPGPTPGTYHATITASTRAGVATITATDSSPSPHAITSATLTQTDGPPATVTVKLSPSTIVANGSSTTTATATVSDTNGNAIAGQTVQIASSGSQHVGPVTAGATPGTYLATITSTTAPGPATITATDSSPTTPITGHTTLTQTALPATSVVLTLSPASITASGSLDHDRHRNRDRSKRHPCHRRHGHDRQLRRTERRVRHRRRDPRHVSGDDHFDDDRRERPDHRDRYVGLPAYLRAGNSQADIRPGRERRHYAIANLSARGWLIEHHRDRDRERCARQPGGRRQRGVLIQRHERDARLRQRPRRRHLHRNDHRLDGSPRRDDHRHRHLGLAACLRPGDAEPNRTAASRLDTNAEHAGTGARRTDPPRAKHHDAACERAADPRTAARQG